MSFPETAKINQQGHLEIGGCDTVHLAKQFGTPLYLIDELTLRHAAKAYRTAFPAPRFNVIFASKSLSVLRVLQMVHEEGLGLDVVSGGELYAALKAHIPAQVIYFHGNNKSRAELVMALEAGVGRIVVDSQSELDLLKEIAKERGKRVPILLRLIPGIEAHTHEFIQTGKLDSKFGIPKEELLPIITHLKADPSIQLVGIHAHIGSQILEISPFVATLQLLLDFSLQIYRETGVVLEEIDMGGGLGISYQQAEVPPRVEALAHALTAVLQETEKRLPFPMPRITLEPGRSLVGQAGVTLYEVGTIKALPGIRKYVAVDGGMSDNPRPITYQAVYEAMVANKGNEPATEPVTIAGKHCESGDILLKDVMLPPLASGDLLAISCTGAYNHAMASNYNRMCRPAMVLLKEGNPELIVRRETYEDLLRMEVDNEG